ncbi:MAG: glutamate 5-kinase [Promicromonosporaceae bacterium]|nr:glutamate 5-kinase [Promicromonosporaceae bacterium]
MQSRDQVAAAARVVLKVGSSSLTASDGTLDSAALTGLVDTLAARRAGGGQVVLVTSGAVAAGLAPLGLTGRPKDTATLQAAAAVGQGLLMARYTEAFAAHGLSVAQVLLTSDDTVHRSRFANAQRTLSRLLDLGVIPIINENDAVTTDELKFGDNDRLAALVAHLVRADALVLLTDVDGLHTAAPSTPGAERIALVTDLADIAAVPVTSRGSAVGTGGMVTKLESVRIATGDGIPVLLTAAEFAAAALAGADVGTCFTAAAARTSARQAWLAHAAKVRGRLRLDQGAALAVAAGEASLLPAGVTGVEGHFDAGDPVELLSPSGQVVARGLAAFAAAELPQLIGRQTPWLQEALGPEYARPVVPRDFLVVAG